MRRSRPVGLVGVVVLAALVCAFIALRHKDPRRLVLAAYAESRPLELRIDGAPYVPFTSASGGSIGRSRSSAAMREADAVLATRVANLNPAPSDVWQMGRLSLLEGEYERAVFSLQQALLRASDETPIWNDLAAAYFGRAESANRFGDYGQAFELESKALDSDPDNQVAIFNRALTAERLFLFQQSVDDWEHYLTLDRSSAWAAEARQSRDRVNRRISEHSEAVREPLLTFHEFSANVEARGWQLIEPRIEDYAAEAVQKWLPAAFSGTDNADSKAAMRSLRILGRELQEVHDDIWLNDLLASANGSGMTGAAAALSRSFQDSDKQDFGSAMSNAISAERLFGAAHNNVGLQLARLERVHTLHFADNGPECIRLASSASRSLDGHHYTWISIQLELEQAVCEAQQERLDSAARRYRDSLRAAENAKYPALFLRALSFTAHVAREDGKQRQAWTLGRDGLQQYWASALPAMRGYNFYFLFEEMAAEAHLWRLQIAIDEQGLQLLKPDWPLFQAVLYSNIAHAGLLLGRSEGAERSNQEAQRILDSAPPSEARTTYQAGLAINRAGVAGIRGDPRRGLQQLAAISPQLQRFFNADEFIRYYRTAGELYSSAGDALNSIDRLQAAVALLERQRSSIRSEADRLSWDRNAAPVYRDLLQSEPGGSGAPSLLADWEYLQDAAIRAPWQPVKTVSTDQVERDAEDVRRELREEQDWLLDFASTLPKRSVLVYAFVGKRLAIWTLGPRGIELDWVAMDPEVVRMLAASLEEQCADANSSLIAIQQAGRQLYDVLIKPIAARLGEHDGLIVEADEGLDEIPFQVLIGPDGKYLSESHSITYTPSVRYLAGLRRDSPGITEARDSLIVAVSHGDAENHLLPLTDAVEEAHDVARHFGHPNVLVEDKASLAAVREGLSRAAVFHFAGHSRITPERVQLMLAADGAAGSSETLDVDSLGTAQMPDLQLAVLSACSTEWTPEGGLLDPASLARAFLRAGVPHVVAARWNVESSATKTLMKVLYGELLRGDTVGRALAAAEAQVRNQYPHPYYWAGFDAFGEN